MKITIDIPDEFINDYITDKFKDFFSRVAADIDNDGLCGNYEKETAEMFLKAFGKSGRETNADKEPKMERLTIKTEDGYERRSIRTKNQQLIDKLAYYENLEEQDRFVKLPCKPGDTVYYINPDKNTINELVVYGFDIRPLQRFVYDYIGARLNFNQFGKTVFLIKAEAKAKMKKLRGEEDEV